MLLDRTSIEQVTADDILTLIPGVPEGRRLDYKGRLPEETVPGIRCFLEDVTALANTAGGFLVYGIEEEGGLPTGIPGVHAVPDDEAFKILWTGHATNTELVEPRLIPEPRMMFVEVEPGKRVLVVYVPKSLQAPHWCRYKEKARKFYVRHEANNGLMDIGELKHAFVEAEAVPERLDVFRKERAAAILANEVQIPLLEGFKAVLHLAPLSALHPDAPLFNVKDMQGLGSLAVFGENLYQQRLNFDGRLFFSSLQDAFSRCYMQVFRNGVIEMVGSGNGFLTRHERLPEAVGLLANRLEFTILQSVGNALGVMTQLAIQPPVYVCLTLLGTKEMVMLTRHERWVEFAIDRDWLFVPPVVSETMNEYTGTLMKPALDVLWQASGVPESPHFDASGEWVGSAG